jgi:hypothetical protein
MRRSTRGATLSALSVPKRTDKVRRKRRAQASTRASSSTLIPAGATVSRPKTTARKTQTSARLVTSSSVPPSVVVPAAPVLCYLLRPQAGVCAPKRVNAWYIGQTNDLGRRLRQHNGELTGGARRTRLARPWELIATVEGFPSQVLPARFLSYSALVLSMTWWRADHGHAI